MPGMIRTHREGTEEHEHCHTHCPPAADPLQEGGARGNETERDESVYTFKMPKPPTKYAIPTFRKGDMARHLREEYLNKPQIHGVRISSDLVRNHFSSVMAVYGKDPADAKQVGQVAASLRQVVDRLNKGAAITHSQRQALQPLLEFVLAGNYLTAKMCVEAGAPLGLSDYQVRYYIVSYKQKWRRS